MVCRCLQCGRNKACPPMQVSRVRRAINREWPWRLVRGRKWGTEAIIRIQIEHDLRGFVPTRRSDLVVGYGPIEINGKTYILPEYGVGIMRERSVVTLPQ
jgi:hypothetical protein